uniref:GRIP and coiled-coil domain-containing protein 2-like isoform X2 n=1 Tax=Crassostrea virginica TaxID=6565 RepID=A0A8B8DB26_CRAVI|nr:GRIP and coiled-coil domain-containing protein 2-like isoform X2 [Crassostrea virginica]
MSINKGRQGQKSSTKNDAPTSNTVEDTVDKGNGLEPLSEFKETQESKAALHEKEETRGVEPESNCKSSDAQGASVSNQGIHNSKSTGKSKGKTAESIQEDIKKKNEDADDLKQRLIAVKKELEEENQRNAYISHQLHSANKETKELKQRNGKIYQKLQVRDEQYHILEMNFNKCRNEVSALQNSIKREQEKCQKIAEDRDVFKDSWSAGKSRGKTAESIQEEIKKKNEEADDLKQRLITVNKELEEENHRNGIISRQLHTTNRELEELKQRNGKIYQKLQVRDEQYCILEMNFNKCRNEVSALQNSIKREQENCQKIAEDRDLFKDRLQIRDEEYLNLEKKFIKCQNEVSALQISIKGEEEKCQKIAEDRDLFKDRLQIRDEEYLNLEKKFIKCQNEVSALQIGIKGEEEKCQKITEDRDLFKNRLQIRDEEYHILETNFTNCQNEVSTLQNSLKREEEKCQKIAEERDLFKDRLQIRDEEYHILETNFTNCQNEVSTLQNSLKREEEKCQKIAEERDLFKDRFNELAETKSTTGNAHIQDISDLNRSQKLEEKLSELDDNECTLYSDAIESLQENEDLDEKMTVQKLLETFKTCVSFCQLKAEEQEMQLMASVRNSVEFSSAEKVELCKGSMEGQEKDVLTPKDTKMFKDFLKAKGMNSLSHLKRVFLAEHPDCVAQGQPLQDFVLGCLEVCWLAAIQDPPLAFDWTFP